MPAFTRAFLVIYDGVLKKPLTVHSHFWPRSPPPFLNTGLPSEYPAEYPKGRDLKKVLKIVTKK